MTEIENLFIALVPLGVLVLGSVMKSLFNERLSKEKELKSEWRVVLQEDGVSGRGEGI